MINKTRNNGFSTLFSAKFFVTLLIIASTVATQAQVKDIIETNIPNGWKARSGKLGLSEKHFKTGKQSLKWDWKKSNAEITVTDTAFQSVAKDDRSTFVIWIYNEKPNPDHLLFDFKKGDQTATSFKFNLNFTGWRTAWVMYNRDMDGKPISGMDKMVIHAPSSIKKGTLYFDQILYKVNINPRSPMRDEQVPFVNVNSDKAANAHWTALYAFTRIPHYIPLQKEINEKDKQDLKTIENKFKEIILPQSKYKKITLASIEKDFVFWNIKRNGNAITGRPVYELNDTELYADKADRTANEKFKPLSVEAYATLMMNVAGLYNVSKNEAERTRLAQIFMDLLDHSYDQGWAKGSGMGALHHLGYSFKDYYTSCLLMKEVIKQHNKLETTQESMAWFSGLGRSQEKPENIDEGNIDVFNTLLGSMLSSILIMDDSPEKVRQLHEFSNWLSKSIMPNYAIDGTFKPDGAVFHHGTLYPAYAIGGFQGITPIVYTLSKTDFHVKPEAQAYLKKALTLMSYYTNPIKWPISISGRHPTGNWRIASDAYAYMALTGSPNGKENIDKDMASIYLKVVPDQKDKWGKIFEKAGIKPADYAEGHWNLNFGLLDIHRRADWLLTVKGHSRYIVSHESYPGANIFGRYFSYGQLEVDFPQTETDNGSSFKDTGWDWNNLPGTTTLHVPIDKLRANIINADDFSGVEEMLLSDETFAGGTNLNNWQGMFSMKLHGSDKYDLGSFRAIKSYFMFDDLVVALGSNITNDRKDYPTQTTLFQNVLSDKNAEFDFNGTKSVAFPFDKKWTDKKTLTVLDNRGIAYYIPDARALEFTKMEQISRDQKDKTETKGNVAKLVFNHGNAPKNDTYQYAMLIKASATQLADFKTKMGTKTPVYKVLQQDSLAHSVWYAPKNITAQAIFKANENLKDSLLITSDKACLVMYQKGNLAIDMSVTYPDLAFYSGPDDTQILPNGKRKEESIYSKSWYGKPSQSSVVCVTVKGLWKVSSELGEIKSVFVNGNTELSIPCKYGIASQFKLVK
nr:chondroitinase family polysaccharide lyase [uncultured Pedobacter sp.]